MQSTSAVFAKKTLRQVVHTSIGGSTARIHLSNALGSEPVTISDVHLAKPTGDGSTVDTSTDKQVTFGGSSSVTIPVGGEVAGDSTAFPVAADSDVAVSFYVPTETGYTQHNTAQRTNYYSDGDQSADASLNGALTYSSYSFVSNLDVRNADAQGSVVAFGASITDALNSGFGENNRWPDMLARRLLAAGDTIGVLNAGISGNNLLVDGGGAKALTRFRHDALGQPGVKYVIFSDDPINDLLQSDPPGTEQLTDGLSQLINEAHAAGVKFLCSTLTPFENTTTGAGWNSTVEQTREALNAYLKSPVSGCDGIVDQASATSDPDDPAAWLPAYDSGDHLHPNDAGMRAIAGAVDLGLFSTQDAPAKSLEASFDNVAVTRDTNTAPGNIDGGHASMSAEAEADAGLTAGKPVTHNGVTLTWPDAAGTGSPDNVLADGQLISLTGRGSALDMLATSTYGPARGTGSVTYTDGSTSAFTLDVGDWFGGGGDVVARAAYQNREGDTRFDGPADVYLVSVPLDAGKTVATVRLPKVSSPVVAGEAALHVFAMGVTTPQPAAGKVVGLQASHHLLATSRNGLSPLTADQPTRNGWERLTLAP